MQESGKRARGECDGGGASWRMESLAQCHVERLATNAPAANHLLIGGARRAVAKPRPSRCPTRLMACSTRCSHVVVRPWRPRQTHWPFATGRSAAVVDMADTLNASPTASTHATVVSRPSSSQQRSAAPGWPHSLSAGSFHTNPTHAPGN